MMAKDDKGVRVRIAPSPTGYLHLGTVRTALFNYVFAKKKGGSFVVRIEDTDSSRSLPMYESNILEGLSLAGLSWDEGPQQGGAYAPYRQSERTDLYKQYLQQLLDEKKAFWCFCTKEELEKDRNTMLASGIAPKYGGTCRHLTPEQQEQKRQEGRSGVIRVAVPAGIALSFKDSIRGTIETKSDGIGDFVIAKSLTQPLYNFAVVVDDWQMDISHVIRGEDHISNTPKQLFIQKALGVTPPVYAHLPLVLSPDRSKLSKRNLETSFLDYVQDGYLPEALVNFLMFIGWNPGDEREVMTLEEVIEAFDLSQVQKGGAAFNMDKLEWFNVQHIKRLDNTQLLERLKTYMPETWKQHDEEMLLSIVSVVRDRIKKLSDIRELAGFFFTPVVYQADLLSWKGKGLDVSHHNLSEAYGILEKIDIHDFSAENVEEQIMPLANEQGRGEVLWPLRIALSGQKNSPGPFEIAGTLGKEETLRRINHALQLLS
jgi:glutamyl-tRNA synthetase